MDQGRHRDFRQKRRESDDQQPPAARNGQRPDQLPEPDPGRRHPAHRDRAELRGRIRRRHDRRHHQNHAEAQTRQRDRRSGRHLLFARLFKRFFDDFSVVQPELPERPVEPLRFDGNLVRQTDRTNYRIVRIRAKRRVDSLRKQARRALEIRFAAHRSAVRIQRPAQRRIGSQLLPQSARRIGNP